LKLFENLQRLNNRVVVFLASLRIFEVVVFCGFGVAEFAPALEGIVQAGFCGGDEIANLSGKLFALRWNEEIAAQ